VGELDLELESKGMDIQFVVFVDFSKVDVSFVFDR
jgi:hypothetical protein